MSKPVFVRVASALGFFLVCAASNAQPCTGGWLNNNRVGTFVGTCNATIAWDPDGSGPRSEMMVFGGLGTMSSGESSTNICAWDPVTGVWDDMNGGINGRVYALTTDRDGRLIAAGTFTTAGGVAVSNIAAWNGTAWAPLGAGVGGDVYAIASLPNGDIIVGGGFTTAGGASSTRVARWDGTAWSSFPNAINNTVLDIKPFADNTFAICGAFFNAVSGGIISRVAKWDGSKWVGYAQGMNGAVTSLETLANGDLVACGEFSTADGKAVAKLARWDGSTWVAFNNGLTTATTYPRQFFRRANGTLLLAASTGPSTAPITRSTGVLSWNGTSWTSARFPIASSTSSPHVSAEAIGETSSGVAFVGGFFGPNATAVYEWPVTGLLAAPVRTWFDGAVRTVEPHGDGGFVLGGAFTVAGGVPAKGIVKVNGDNWQALGAGLSGTVETVLVLPEGDIVAGGAFSFTDHAGITSKSIALWSQNRWNRFEAGIDGTVHDLALLPGGDIVAGGLFSKAGIASVNNLAYWNGSAWAAFPGGSPNGAVFAVANGRNSELFIGGTFTSVGTLNSQAAAQWTGAEWISMSPGGNIPAVFSLAVLPSGVVVAGGRFSRPLTTVINIGVWDGFGWGAVGGGITSAAGTPTVYSVTVTPNGDIIAAGDFSSAGGVPVSNLARWNNSTWAPIGGGANGIVEQVSRSSKGNFLVGGAFTQVGSTPTRSFAEWQDPAGLTVLSQPQDALSCASADVSFESTTDGNGTKSYRWQIEDPAAVPFGWRDIDDGPLLVNGKQIALAANTKSGSVPLQLTKLRGLSPIKIRFLVYNDCGALLSRTATLRIHAADFNCDNIYDDLDFSLFASAYDLLACDDPAMPAGCPADLNADGVVDDRDFGEFVVAYDAVIPE